MFPPLQVLQGAAPRRVRDAIPQTGEPIKIEAKTTAKFYLAKAVKDAIGEEVVNVHSHSKGQQFRWPFLFSAWLTITPMGKPEPTPTLNQQPSVHAIEKTLGLMKSVHTLADNEKDTVEQLLEVAPESLKRESRR